MNRFFLYYLDAGGPWQLRVIVPALLCLAASFVFLYFKRARLSLVLLYLAWFYVAAWGIWLCSHYLPHFPATASKLELKATINLAVVSEAEFRDAQDKTLRFLLLAVEQLLACISLAALFSLPLCYLSKVARANGRDRAHGVILCCLIVAAIALLEFIRFDIRGELFNFNFFICDGPY